MREWHARLGGLDANFAVGKSEVGMLVRGVGSAAASAKLKALEQKSACGGTVPCLPVADGVAIRVVTVDKYLGARLATPDGTADSQEVALRAADAKAADSPGDSRGHIPVATVCMHLGAKCSRK